MKIYAASDEQDRRLERDEKHCIDIIFNVCIPIFANLKMRFATGLMSIGVGWPRFWGTRIFLGVFFFWLALQGGGP